MNTSFLGNFLIIVETGSIAEASRKTHLSPTALAQQVKALERELGVTLLTRAGRVSSPTPEGHRLALSARGLLRGVADLRQQVISPEQATGFRLGTINTALQSFVPDTLQELSRVNAKLRVFIKTGHASNLLDDVQQGELDAAILPYPQFELPKSLKWVELASEPLVLLAAARHAGADPHRLIATQPYIYYDRLHWGGRIAERYLKQHGLFPKERFELSSLITIAIMVDRDLGVSLVPDAAFPAPAGLRLVKLPLPDAREPRRIGMVWQRSSPLQSVAADLAELARRAIRRPGGRKRPAATTR